MDSEGYIKGTKTGTLDFYNVFPRVEEVDDVTNQIGSGDITRVRLFVHLTF